MSFAEAAAGFDKGRGPTLAPTQPKADASGKRGERGGLSRLALDPGGSRGTHAGVWRMYFKDFDTEAVEARRLSAGDAPSSGEKLEFPELFLDVQLCFSMYYATNKMLRIYGDMLAKAGITFPQCLALMVLWEQSPLNVSEIAKRLDLDAATTTPILKRLEANGFVTRRRGDSDERFVYVDVTQKGLDLRGPILAGKQALLCSSRISAHEVQALRRSLNVFAAKLTPSLN